MDYKVGEQVFNDWQIVREIGSGASGRVWEIVKIDHDISTSSALKVIRVPQNPSMTESLYSDGMDEASEVQFFQGVVDDLTEEIKIMIDMKGFPYIVNCEDYSVIRYQDEIRWDILIRMELLTSLQEYIQREALSEADVLRMGRELLQTIELFESRGIIHRDIKPDNIFVDRYGNFKIGDFGIARMRDKNSVGLSQKGTENYMAPEVYHGKEYDHTVDIYSLGLVLYKLLNNNRLPFYPERGEGSDWDEHQALNDRLSGKKEMPPPCSASPEFGKIILRMCAHNPKERYQKAKEILFDLGQITDQVKGVAGTDDPTGGSFDEMRTIFEKKMVIHNGDAVKKTGKAGRMGTSGNTTGGTGRDSTDPPSLSVLPAGKTDADKKKDRREGGNGSGGVVPPGNYGSGDSGKKKEVPKKTMLQGLAAAVILLALALYFLQGRTYSLSVTDGSGGGTYKGGEEVTVTAKDIPGSAFVKWEVQGRLSLTDEELASKTISFPMPRHKISVKAVYAVNSHRAVINNGSGTGEYDTGEEVSIIADEPGTGQKFSGWDVEDGSVYLEHANKQKTSFVMPDDDVEISAVYENLKYSLQIENGQGSGSYEYGRQVRITAQEKDGQTFSRWAVLEGDFEISEAEQSIPEISVSMPACDIVLRAEYAVNRHKVVVNGGSGSGDYEVGEKVTIAADAADTGMEFAGWEVEEGSVSLQNARKEKTNFDMPDEETVISAVFSEIEYKLSVTDGNGSGTYHYGDQVQISARDSAGDGTQFSHWSVDRGTIALSDPSVKNLTFEMPAEDVAVTAHYGRAKYTLKVDGGRGSGMYEAGSTVTVSAAPADESGVPFAGWEVVSGRITLEDGKQSELSFEMPEENAEIRAVYEAGDAYSVVVFGGTGAGVYSEGDTVTVTAQDEPGKTFNCWFITSKGGESVENDNASFTFTMPASDLIITAVYDTE